MVIGISSYFYRGGYGNTVLDLRKILIDAGIRTFILARNNAPKDEDEFISIPDVEYYPNEKIPINIINYWIKKNQITKLILLGYDDIPEIIIELKKNNIEIISIPMWENVGDILDYKEYDKIICPTKICYRLFEKFPQARYIKWGFDETIFKPVNVDSPLLLPLKIFHPVGKPSKGDLSGKIPSLKGFFHNNRITINDVTGEVLTEALLYIHTCQSDLENKSYNIGNLIIGNQNLSRIEMALLYQCSDVALLPSRVEGLGLSFLEAIGCGLPIISVDEAPMNEFIISSYTGLLCQKDFLVKDISYYIDALSSEKDYYANLKSNVLKHRTEWSWLNNKKNLINMIQNPL